MRLKGKNKSDGYDNEISFDDDDYHDGYNCDYVDDDYREDF